MATVSRFLLLILALVFLATTALVRVDAGNVSSDLSTLFLTSRSGGCSTGSMGECLGDDEEEFSLDSEISRRILANNRYISYGSLGRNNIPCSRRGASYYNCRPGASANPYRRGCSAITRCRS